MGIMTGAKEQSYTSHHFSLMNGSVHHHHIWPYVTRWLPRYQHAPSRVASRDNLYKNLVNALRSTNEWISDDGRFSIFLTQWKAMFYVYLVCFLSVLAVFSGRASILGGKSKKDYIRPGHCRRISNKLFSGS